MDEPPVSTPIFINPVDIDGPKDPKPTSPTLHSEPTPAAPENVEPVPSPTRDGVFGSDPAYPATEIEQTTGNSPTRSPLKIEIEVEAEETEMGASTDEGEGEVIKAGTTPDIPTNEATSNMVQQPSHQAAEEEQLCAVETFAEQLTASNMLYWMWAVRILYFVVGLVLQQWGRSYQKSSKKFHLMSYWLQFTMFVPLLAVLALSLVAIQSDTVLLTKTGLILLAHAAMVLLGLVSMEIFLRAMDSTLFLQRLVVLATLVYVIGFEDAGLENPMHQITFGAIEAVGVCSELAAQWNLINYRSWSDAASQEKERMQHGIAFTLKVCLLCSVLSKAVFYGCSIAWYVLRFDGLQGSYLLFVLPAVRVVQTPALIRSLYVQMRLYRKVATFAVPEKFDGKVSVSESSTDKSFYAHSIRNEDV